MSIILFQGDALAGLVGLVVIIVVGLLGLAFYFIPSIVAVLRGCQSIGGIIILNVFLGWTFLGWLGALIWAASGEVSRPMAVQLIKCPRCYNAIAGTSLQCPRCLYLLR